MIGLGYVGLPIALEFAKKISVIGFDINQRRVEMMQKVSIPARKWKRKHLRNCDIDFTDDPGDTERGKFFYCRRAYTGR